MAKKPDTNRPSESETKEETLFRGLFDHMPSGAAIYEVKNGGTKGADYIVRSFNKTALKYEGKTPDQVVGKSLSDLRPAIDDYGLIPIMKRVWETGVPARYPVTRYQDEHFSNYYENVIFRLPSGELVTIYDDVTRRKETEQALRESKERFELAMRFSNDGIFDWNVETDHIYYSPGWKRMLGYEDHEIKNQFSEWERLTRPEDVKAARKMLSELLGGTRDRFELEFQMRHREGRWIDILSRANVVFDENGKPVRVVGTHVDITERKRMEESLRKSETLHKYAQRVARLGHWELIPSAGTLEWCEEIYHILGLDPSKDIPQLQDHKHIVHPEDWPLYEQTIKKAMADGIPFDMEFRFVRPDGEIRWMNAKGEVEKDGEGNVARLFGTAQDITPRKRAEAEREAMEKQLRHGQKMEAIGTLAGGIAHDFNNILASVIGYTDLALSEVDENTPVEGYLREVYTAGNRAADLVRQILTFARQSEETPMPVQVSTIAKEALKLLRATLPTSITIRQHIDSNSCVMADPTQIHQILMNLFTNALQAMPEATGQIEVHVTDTVLDKGDADRIRDLEPGSYLKMVVRDTGKGILKEHLDSIFVPYFTTRAREEGTGLGLSVVHGIVKGCGGEIAVSSQPGKGTTFTIHLPVTAQNDAAETCAPQTLRTGTESLLIVDDEATIVKLNARILESLGYRVTASASSTEALELFRASPDHFDLVITDMAMPGMTGDKLAGELMRIKPGLPVILCTGHSQWISPEKAERMGVKRLCMKPLSKADLAQAVRQVLEEG